MKFSEWIKFREMNQMGQSPIKNAGPMVKKPAGRDKTVDNVKNILKKSSDPKSPATIKQVSQIYDTEMDKSTDSGEIASIASKKSAVLSSLQK